MLSVYSYSKSVFQKSPYYKLLNILIIFIDNSYNQTALASFVIANARNCDPSWWMCKHRSGAEMYFFSVPAGNLLKHVLNEKSVTLFAGVYSLDWFELVHTVSLGYLCLDNHGIVRAQPRNINPRRPLKKFLWPGPMILTLVMVETKLRCLKVQE